MATRMQAREAVVQLLYARELGNDKALEQAHSFLYESKIRNKQQEFALALLYGICDSETIILQIMDMFLTSWNTERLGIIEKNILKLGIYELLETTTQRAVIINESIELTKNFNLSEASGLVNGVLDSIAKKNVKGLNNFLQILTSLECENKTESQIPKTLDNNAPINNGEIHQSNIPKILPKKSKNVSNKYVDKKQTKKQGKTNKQPQKIMQTKGKVHRVNLSITQQKMKQSHSNLQSSLETTPSCSHDDSDTPQPHKE